MYHFLGIILEVSIDNRQFGKGCIFPRLPNELKYDPGHSIKIARFSLCAANVMPIYCFRQICAALHPERGPSTVEDCYHQLHASIVCLNTHAKRSFILDRQYSFN
jgi:hypothetical protein